MASYLDDIVISGRTEREHNDNPYKVLERVMLNLKGVSFLCHQYIWNLFLTKMVSDLISQEW